jgi:hypothetical protein
MSRLEEEDTETDKSLPTTAPGSLALDYDELLADFVDPLTWSVSRRLWLVNVHPL